MVNSAVMEIAAEIMETSADIEKTVDGTGVFNLMLGIVLALKRMFVSVLLSCKNHNGISYERAKTAVLGRNCWSSDEVRPTARGVLAPFGRFPASHRSREKMMW